VTRPSPSPHESPSHHERDNPAPEADPWASLQRSDEPSATDRCARGRDDSHPKADPLPDTSRAAETRSTDDAAGRHPVPEANPGSTRARPLSRGGRTRGSLRREGAVRESRRGGLRRRDRSGGRRPDRKARRTRSDAMGLFEGLHAA
jgi:hypothetical protein